MTAAPAVVQAQLDLLIPRLQAMESLSPKDALIVRLAEQYPGK